MLPLEQQDRGEEEEEWMEGGEKEGGRSGRREEERRKEGRTIVEEGRSVEPDPYYWEREERESERFSQREGGKTLCLGHPAEWYKFMCSDQVQDLS